jgi:hypothetical protein
MENKILACRVEEVWLWLTDQTKTKPSCHFQSTRHSLNRNTLVHTQIITLLSWSDALLSQYLNT